MTRSLLLLCFLLCAVPALVLPSGVPCIAGYRGVYLPVAEPVLEVLREEDVADAVRSRLPFLVPARAGLKGLGAVGRWTPERLQSLVSPELELPLSEPKRNDTLFLYYDQRQPLHALIVDDVTHPPDVHESSLAHHVSTLVHSNNTQLRYLPFGQVWDAIVQGEPGYFSSSVQRLQSPPMLEDTTPPVWMTISSSRGRPEANLWMGGKEVTAQMHYDEAHNFYTQVYGRKKVILSPPVSHWNARLHPWIHPSQRQSQLPFRHPNFPKNAYSSWVGREASDICVAVDIPSIEVELLPGDVLYIPPYWFHHFTSATAGSISVSIWQEPTLEMDVVESLNALPLPFDVEWSQGQLLLAIKMYFNHLLKSPILSICPEEKLADSEEESNCWTRVVETRYLPLFGRLPHVSMLSSAYIVRLLQESDHIPLGSIPPSTWLVCDPQVASTQKGHQDFLSSIEKSVAARAAEAHNLLRALCPRPEFPQARQEQCAAVLEIVVADYLETVANFMLGPENVNPFMQLCSGYHSSHL